MRHSNPYFVCETSTSTGSGNLTLSGAVTGHQAFSIFTNTGYDGFKYRIELVNGENEPSTEWENGVGRITSANTLERIHVLASSNSGSAVTFSAGTKWVYIYRDAFSLESVRKTPREFHDMLLAGTAGAPPFFGTAISSGTIAAIAGSGKHPGVVQLRSSTTNNSGYRLDGGNQRLQGGEYFNIVFRIPTLTATTIRFGFRDNTTSADVVDGIYIEVPASGAAVLKTASNSTRTTSSTIATLSTNTWYSAHIFLRGDAGEASGLIANESGTVQGVQFNTTNIPTAAGRETSIGAIATSTSLAVTNLLDIDCMGFGFSKPLVR